MKSRLILPIVFAFAFPHLVMPVYAQVVPGSGQQIVEVFDDFEDPTWSFTLNLPKSSANIDKVERHPGGAANNRLFLESMYRGTPDFVRRIETPPGGIKGSTGALAMQTLNSGIPGELSHTFQQDDLIAGVQTKLGYMMPVSWTPSYVCRVYIPPFEKWERRHGSHFGFRADCTTTIEKANVKGRFFKNLGTHKALEQYWPGFFVQLNLKQSTGQPEDSAMLLIRSDDKGHEVPGPKITHPGWWTLGMTFTPDGKVHYYAHEGVADLTSKDFVYSGFPYGYHCEQTSTYFFNVVNQDDGRSWSTRWIVDDPKVYVATGSYRPPAAQQVAQKLPAASTPQAAAPVTGVQPPAAQAPTAKAPAAQTLAGQVPAIQPVPPAKQAQVPAAKTAQNTVPSTPVVVKPAESSIANSATPPATKPPTVSSIPNPAIPQLASKPTEIQVVAPKEKASESTNAVPATLPESTPDSTTPPPVSPNVEEPTVPVTPSSSLDTPAKEAAAGAKEALETPAISEAPAKSE